ncbi:MAG TPA: hypothetical protein VMZ32_08750 [Gammaproteobacteria bacterium]|nr:hypothetical protein [Gammaproteobacteria bacterium]
MNPVYAALEPGKSPAKPVLLSPISMLKRTAQVHPDQVAMVNDLRTHCRERLAGFKRPKRPVIGELPKTSTGKIHNNELRDRARLVS